MLVNEKIDVDKSSKSMEQKSLEVRKRLNAAVRLDEGEIQSS